MCGLVGIFSSNMLMKHKEVLNTLLYLDTFRGKDSTGVAAIRQNADTAILKSTVPGYEFIEGPRLNDMLRITDFCWIGHNRFGTMGKNVRSNSHPFQVLDGDGSCLLVGAHNGTLKNKHELTNHINFGTDSEALYNEIANIGVDKAIAKAEGAWALTYYDHVTEELRILRNKERPLFYAYSEDRKTLFWASEMWMIRVACSRHDIKLEEDKVYTFSEDTLYCFPSPEKTNDKITSTRQGGLVGKTSTFFRHGTGGTGGGTASTWRAPLSKTTQTTQSPGPTVVSGTSNSSGVQEPTSGVTQPPKNGDSSSNQSLGDEDRALHKIRNILSAKRYKGYGGVLLTKKELEDQLAGGCGWCELEFIAERDRYAFVAPARAVCSKCLDGVPMKDKINLPQGVSVH